MCGRLYRDQDPEDDPGETWRLTTIDEDAFREIERVWKLTPTYNATPSQIQPVVVEGKGGRRMVPMQWGLVGRNGGSIAPSNARAETAFELPMFRNLIGTRRCILPTNGYFEWQGRQPWYLTAKDGRMWGLAAIYDTTSTKEGAVGSFAVVTVEANAAIKDIHHRMPVILPHDEAVDAWLSRDVRDPRAVAALLRQYPAELMDWWPVSRKVNNPRNDGPELIARRDAEPVQTELFALA